MNIWNSTKLRHTTATFFGTLLTMFLLPNQSMAAIDVNDYKSIPVGLSVEMKPLTMLLMSNDHQLFTKAYTDYEDIIDASSGTPVAGSDGILETTYTDSFDYYGYFGSNKCYTYDTTDGRFEPTTTTPSGTYSHHCANAEWSGNFLNWASMTKMDILRKVLYGGYRSTDTGYPSASTVLERAPIPKDGHAFVKVFTTSTNPEMRLYTPYNSTEISLCNVTHLSSGVSHDSTAVATPPSIRVADGNWSRWSSSEVAQCEWSDDTGANNSMGNLPQSGGSNDELGTYNARVQVCVSDSNKEDNCSEYEDNSGNTTLKPTGLLQEYANQMEFGLISGSYVENNEGGVLRKNISDITTEINTDTGVFNSSQGIINTISSFRMTSYNYGNKRYDDCSTYSIPVSTFLTSTDSGRQCQNWGNPLTEMYLEALRYFSGEASPTSAFNTDDSSLITTTNGMPATLNPVSWSDPLNADNYCAKCNIIVLSSGLNSFDMDSLGSAGDISGISGAADVVTKTNQLTTTEGISGNYFIGDNGTTNDGKCTSKALSDLGDAKGICPEEPFAQGGYGVAGLSYHAYTNDLRSGLLGKQNVNTYAVALSQGLPKFQIPVNGRTITIMPSCEANTTGTAALGDSGWTQCSLVGLEVINPTYSGSDLTSGKIRVHWEDSHWGNDYDMDGVSDIDFCVGSVCPSGVVAADQLEVTVSSPLANAGNALKFGYAIGGTFGADGIYFPLLRPGGVNFNSISPGTGSVLNCSTPSDCVNTFTPGATATSILESPLWYAAKWGKFNDLNADNVPDSASEWDIENNSNAASGSDGLPDNYFLASNPATLESQLERVFDDIVERVAAGTAAAVIADTVSMTGSVIQALYQPLLTKDTTFIKWAGLLHAIFIDENGHLREDTDSNDRLTPTDRYIKVLYAEDLRRTMLYYCTGPTVCTAADNRNTPSTDRVELENIKSIWNVRDELATIPDTLIHAQRPYSTPFNDASNGGRHIITWLDDADGNVEPSEVVAFSTPNFTSSNYGYLDAADETEADNIVNWIRGKEISGYRNRTIDYDDDSTDEVWRLGDIVHSTPYVVSRPIGSIISGQPILWDVRYGDPTYSEFRVQYDSRRNVVIAGANDGMIHAFNAGFFDPASLTYNLTRAQADHESSAPVSHPLGAELWAYVPKNLHPQLKFLTEENYPHVYYMDGKPRVFDVNIFPPSATHPKGWGTILVMGMRFGGGTKTTAIGVDIDNADGDNDGSTNTDYQTTSAYVILDITDPEQPPRVLGEFTDVDHGFTTSAPDLLVRRSPQALTFSWEPADVATNDWYLVFGTGPTDLDDGTSTQNAKVVALKLAYDTTNNALDMAAGNIVEIDTTIANSFVGDPATVDFTYAPSDYDTDAIYFGVTGGTAAAPTGQLMRIALTSDTTTDWQSASNRAALINPTVGQPFVARPNVRGVKDPNSNFIDMRVYMGTGRLFTSADNFSTQTQSYYGIRDRGTSANPDIPDVSITFTTDSGSSSGLTALSPAPVVPVPTTNLIQNITGIVVNLDSSVTIPSPIDLDFSADTDTFAELVAEMETRSGWYFNFDVPSAAERTVADTALFQNLLLFTSHSPGGEACDSLGTGNLYVISEVTGTAVPLSGLSTATEVVASVDVGIGQPSDVTLFQNLGGTRPIIQMSTGEIVDTGNLGTGGNPPCPGCGPNPGGYEPGRQSWREIFNF